jgi:uncharacterized phiE125 gp8 family phage protein
MALKLITAAGAPVTLAEAKLACRFDPTDLDADITAMILDATRLVEHETGQCLMSQTWELTLDGFTPALELTRNPVASITSIRYYDTAGAQQLLADTAYELKAADTYSNAFVVPVHGTTWPATLDQAQAVAVRYIAGYPDAASVPSHLKRQVKIMVAQLLDDPLAMQDRLAAIDKRWLA